MPGYNPSDDLHWPAPRVDRTSLSEDERTAIATALKYGDMLTIAERLTLGALMERTTPKKKVRYVVHCISRHGRRVWAKTYYDKQAAQNYARHAVESWCDQSAVRIVKQKWISY